MVNAISVFKFLGPHLLGLMRDAVNKWNDEIPATHHNEFDKEMEIISGKVLHLPDVDAVLPSGRSLRKEVEIARSLDERTCKSIIRLMDSTHEYMVMKYKAMSISAVSAICRRDDHALFSIHQDSGQMISRFGASYSLADKFGKESSGNRIKTRLIDDALLAVSRIMPDRMVCSSGTLIIRDLVPILYPSVTEGELQEMREAFTNMYDITVYKSLLSHTSVRLVPKQAFISEAILSHIYGHDFSNLTIVHMMSIDDHRWWVKQDINISVTAILNKVMGSSITSLSTVVTDLCIFMFLMLKNGNTTMTDEEAQSLIRAGPWTCVEDTMSFISPINLYDQVPTEVRSRQNLSKDFTTMLCLLELYRLHVSDFGDEVFTSSDPSRPTRGSSRVYSMRYPTAPPPTYNINEVGAEFREDVMNLIRDARAANHELRRLHTEVSAIRYDVRNHQEGVIKNLDGCISTVASKLGLDLPST